MKRPCEHCYAPTEEYALRIAHIGKPSSAHAVCERCFQLLASPAEYAAKPIQGALSRFFAVQEIPLHSVNKKETDRV